MRIEPTKMDFNIQTGPLSSGLYRVHSKDSLVTCKLAYPFISLLWGRFKIKLVKFLKWLLSFLVQEEKRQNANPYFTYYDVDKEMVKYCVIRNGKVIEDERGVFGLNRAHLIDLAFTNPHVLLDVMKRANIHKLSTSDFKKAKILWDIGLCTQSRFSIKLKSTEDYSNIIMGMIQKAFKENNSLDPKGKEAVWNIQKGLLQAIISEDLYRNNSIKKAKLTKLENVLGPFDVQGLIARAGEGDQYFKKSLEELKEAKACNASVPMRKISLALSDIFTLMDATDTQLEKILIPRMTEFIFTKKE